MVCTFRIRCTMQGCFGVELYGLLKVPHMFARLVESENPRMLKALFCKGCTMSDLGVVRPNIGYISDTATNHFPALHYYTHLLIRFDPKSRRPQISVFKDGTDCQMSNFITTHDSNGKAVFSDLIPTEQEQIPIPIGRLTTLWTTSSFPTNLSSSSDFERYAPHRTQLPPKGQICPPNGTSVLIMDIVPNAERVMHRTLTLDVVIVMDGAVEIRLDSGEKRVLKKGDSIVQRATMHEWSNPFEEWAKLAVFVQACNEPVVVGGKELRAEWP